MLAVPNLAQIRIVESMASYWRRTVAEEPTVPNYNIYVKWRCARRKKQTVRAIILPNGKLYVRRQQLLAL